MQVLDGLVLIGGDVKFRERNELHQQGIRVSGIPAYISIILF